MIPLNFSSIKRYLDQTKQGFQVQTETGQLFLLSKQGQMEIPLFLRIDESSKMVQLLAFLPHNLTKSAHYGELARLLLFLNKEMDLPGFGVDEAQGILFYRYVISAPDGSISTNSLDQLVQAMPRVIALFFPVILMVSMGSLSYEQSLPKAQEVLKQFGEKKG